MDNEREASAKWFDGISEMKSMCVALLIAVARASVSREASFDVEWKAQFGFSYAPMIARWLYLSFQLSTEFHCIAI